MVNWDIFGYIGIVFAMIYRIPQIIKIYKKNKPTWKGGQNE